MPVAAFFVFFYAGLGLLQPLLPLYLTDHGLPPHVATAVLALGPLAAIIAPPAVGVVADAFRARTSILRGLTLLCTFSLVAFMQAPASVKALVAVSLVYAVLRAPLPPLADAAAYASAERTGTTYGRLRMFGSIGFMCAVFAGGQVVHTFGWDTLLAATVVAFALAFIATLLLPTQVAPERARLGIPWLRVLENRELWVFLAVIAISQLANAAYDACYALHLKRIGFSERFIGLALGVSLVAEVLVLSASAWFVRKWGPERLLAFAFATGAVRWFLLSTTTHAAPILALQLLHGITFPLYWVPAVILVHRYLPPQLGTAAQGLLTMAVNIGSMVGMWIAGPLLESGGGARVYSYASVMALTATVGAVVLARAMRPATAA